jgi:uncharacterized protein
MKPFVVNVANLVHRPARRRAEELSGPTAKLFVTETFVPEGGQLEVSVLLEAVSDGILAVGEAKVNWHAECRRCIRPIIGLSQVEFREMYSENPVEGETYPIKHESVDIELVAREAILLDLPLAPLCREECAGLCLTCGSDLNDGPCTCAPAAIDPRWTVLSGLRVDELELPES